MDNRKNIADKILAHYRDLQKKREQKLNEKLEFLHGVDLEFENIEREISSLGIKMAAKAAMGGMNIDDIVKELDLSLDALKKKRLELYKKYDIEPDFLEIAYMCDACKDTGYTPDGKKCSCRIKCEIECAKEASSIPSEISGYSFDDFDLKYYSKVPNSVYGISSYDNAKSVLSSCKDFCESFGKETKNLYIYGDTGIGKTMLVNCIANELISKNNVIMYQTASNLFKIIEGYKFGKNTSDELNLLYDNLYSCDLLIIDDLGTEMQNSFTQSMLFDILNTRLINNKSTVISSNLLINDLSNTYTSRISSRIIGEYELLILFGDDIRIQKKKM